MESEFLLPEHEKKAIHFLTLQDTFKAAYYFKQAYKMETYLEQGTPCWPELTFPTSHCLHVEQLSQIASLMENVFDKNALFHWRFASLYLCLHAYENSMLHLQSAINCAKIKNKYYSTPFLATCIFELVNHLIRIKKYKDAERICQTAITDFPSNATVPFGLVSLKPKNGS